MLAAAAGDYRTDLGLEYVNLAKDIIDLTKSILWSSVSLFLLLFVGKPFAIVSIMRIILCV